MAGTGGLTGAVVRGVFQEEVEELGGTVAGVHVFEGALYARAVLARQVEVGPEDLVRSGVAASFCAGSLSVRPYVFRVVCSNGAIFARALEAWEVEHVGAREPGEVVAELREAVRACGSGRAFEGCAGAMRGAHGDRASLELMMLAFGETHGAMGRAMRRVAGRFGEQRDRSRFGLMNAVTSVARETPVHRVRWDLEEVGGAIAMGASRGPRRPLESVGRVASAMLAELTGSGGEGAEQAEGGRASVAR